MRQGDPIVLYDWLADRWILTHLAFSFSGLNPASPFYQCIAASKTSDPVTGGWWLYAIRLDPGGANLPPVNDLNDYPKFGLWHDCLYMASNEFTCPSGNYDGVAFASFSRCGPVQRCPADLRTGLAASDQQRIHADPEQQLRARVRMRPSPVRRIISSPNRGRSSSTKSAS